jgi:hypothetical protein
MVRELVLLPVFTIPPAVAGSMLAWFIQPGAALPTWSFRLIAWPLIFAVGAVWLYLERSPMKLPRFRLSLKMMLGIVTVTGVLIGEEMRIARLRERLAAEHRALRESENGRQSPKRLQARTRSCPAGRYSG